MPKARNIVFEVPDTVKTAPQRGWVYRSDHAPGPERRAVRRARRGTDAADLFLTFFALPFFFVTALIAPATARNRRRPPSHP